MYKVSCCWLKFMWKWNPEQKGREGDLLIGEKAMLGVQMFLGSITGIAK